VLIFRLKSQQAVEAVREAQKLAIAAVDGEQNLLYSAACERLIKEAYLKVYSSRNKTVLDDA
jgi:hypothetical protein